MTLTESHTSWQTKAAANISNPSANVPNRGHVKSLFFYDIQNHAVALRIMCQDGSDSSGLEPEVQFLFLKATAPFCRWHTSITHVSPAAASASRPIWVLHSRSLCARPGPQEGPHCGWQSSEHILLRLQTKVFFGANCGQAYGKISVQQRAGITWKRKKKEKKKRKSNVSWWA